MNIEKLIYNVKTRASSENFRPNQIQIQLSLTHGLRHNILPLFRVTCKYVPERILTFIAFKCDSLINESHENLSLTRDIKMQTAYIKVRIRVPH